jgi:hypothetical protein
MLNALRQHFRFITYGVLTAILLIHFARTVSICDFNFTQCPSAPWSTQLATAQKAAHRRGRDFALVQVLAKPRYLGKDEGYDLRTLEVRFDFVRPSSTAVDGMARALSVTIDDTNPRTSVRILGGEYYSNQQPTPAFQRTIQLARIGPAEALQQALPKAPQTAGFRGDVLIGLHPSYEDEQPITPDTPAWKVIFFTEPLSSSKAVYIDAQTGEIVKED